MLTKNQVFQSIIADLMGEEDSKMWDYVASVVLKAIIKNCNDQEKEEFKNLLETNKHEKTDEFVEKKIQPLLPNIQKEIEVFMKKFKNEALQKQ